MIPPNRQLDSSNRIKCAISAGGAAPTTTVGGVGFDATGRVLCDSNAVTGALVLNGFARNTTNGSIFTTTTQAAGDTFSNGYRYNAGALVIGLETVPTLFVNGSGFDANGALCVTSV